MESMRSRKLAISILLALGGIVILIATITAED